MFKQQRFFLSWLLILMHRTKGLLDTSAMMLLLNDMIFFLIYYNFKKIVLIAYVYL